MILIHRLVTGARPMSLTLGLRHQQCGLDFTALCVFKVVLLSDLSGARATITWDDYNGMGVQEEFGPAMVKLLQLVS